MTYREDVTGSKPETIVLAAPTVDGTPAEREAWAKAVIEAKRPQAK